MNFTSIKEKIKLLKLISTKLGVVISTCHPSYAGHLNRRIKISGHPRQKQETLSEK
jgi:hypothetical protein